MKGPEKISRLLSTLALAMVIAEVPAVAADAVAIEGTDRARLLPPAGAVVTDYENAGYRLRRDGEEVVVEVEIFALESRSPFSPPPPATGSDSVSDFAGVSRLARGLTAGADSHYEAISRILGWVARSISYELDRESSQEADQVLDRRTGYCTGIARLTVALLRAAGIQAREVAGYVVADAGTGEPAGYHRWIEAYLPDRGWVYSDPLRSHHYVPATYLRLADETLEPIEGIEGLLIERREASARIDVYPYGAPGITARRSSPRQLAAVLEVDLGTPVAGTAVLTGRSQRRSRRLVDGATTFVGLEPGHYVLRLELPGGSLERNVDFPNRLRRKISLPVLATHAFATRDTRLTVPPTHVDGARR